MMTLDVNEKAISHPLEVHTHSGIDGNDSISPAPSSSELDDSYEIYQLGRGVVIDAVEGRACGARPIGISCPFCVSRTGSTISTRTPSVSQAYTGCRQERIWSARTTVGLVRRALRRTYRVVSDGVVIIGSIFYFGYLFSQFPAGYLMQRFPVGKFLSIMTVIWVCRLCSLST